MKINFLFLFLVLCCSCVSAQPIDHTGTTVYAMAGPSGYELTNSRRPHGATFRFGLRYDLENNYFVHASGGFHSMSMEGRTTGFSSWEGGFGGYIMDAFSVSVNMGYYTNSLNGNGGYGISLRPALDVFEIAPDLYLSIAAGVELVGPDNFAFTGLLGLSKNL